MLKNVNDPSELTVNLDAKDVDVVPGLVAIENRLAFVPTYSVNNKALELDAALLRATAA